MTPDAKTPDAKTDDAQRHPASPADSAPTDQPSSDQSERPKILCDLDLHKSLEERVVDVLRTVFDPEIPVNIYELGLVYDVEVDEDAGRVKVSMTLTSPACPVAGTLPGDVEIRIKQLEDVNEAEVELVWEPPWDKDRLSEAAKLQLGLS